MEARRFAGFLVGLLLLSLAADPLPADFDLDAYLDHLERTRDLDTEGLFRSHEPFGPYQPTVSIRDEAPVYLKEIDDWLDLTDGELLLLQRHDFVVSERWRQESYGHAFQKIFRLDLPVFVSTDAILHAVHKSYDDLLAYAEDSYFLPALSDALFDMHRHWPQLKERYGQNAEMEPNLADIDVFLTVAYKLLHPRTSLASQSGNDEEVQEILRLVHLEQPARIALFNAEDRWYDFSQLKPRGHYLGEEYPELQHYFRAMMWLGRTEFRLTPPPPAPGEPDVDVTREIIDAFLLLELARESDAAERLNEIDRVLRMLIAPPDNVTSHELERLGEAIGLDSAASLLAPDVKAAFHQELTSGEYTRQAILSQIMAFDAYSRDPQEIPYAFLLMGQRFLIDSFITGQVVYPFVPCVDLGPPLICRQMPDPLDVLYSLGNDDALPFLRGEIERHKYARNLSALHYLIGSLEPEYWQGSVYNSWLQAIRTLSKTGRQENVPDFMRTGAWQQEKMNTQLAAWAELRHDNLLYGKQSYTGIPATCSFPCTYIEPVPAFYEALERFAEGAGETFSTIPSIPEAVVSFFARMKDIMSRLRGIAEKELSGASFTDEETRFLRSVIYDLRSYDSSVCTHEVTVHYEVGWYPELYFQASVSEESKPAREPDALIADVHTDPNSRSVLHVGTGDPDLGIFIAAARGYPETAYVGPVASYHEHVTMNFLRLTDEEWNVIYRSNPPDRPDWTYIYLANRDGNVRERGRALEDESGSPDVPWDWTYPPPPPQDMDPPDTPSDSTETPPDDPPGTPPDSTATPGELGSGNIFMITPNPVRQGAIVSLRFDDGYAPVRLLIFDSQGGLVRELHEGWIPPHLTHIQWDGTTASGHRAGAGVYYVRLEVGKRVATTRKIVVVH